MAPGRFLMPGDLEGSPALTFSPLPEPARTPGNSLWRAFDRRFEAYKRVVVEPFFRNHFARLDRQVVLIDALGAIHDGPRAWRTCAPPWPRSSRASAPAGIPGWRRSSAAASTASSSPPPRPTTCTTRSIPEAAAIAEALVKDARARAQFHGAETRALSIASLRATVEQTVPATAARSTSSAAA